MKTKIYTLNAPDGEIRYVGKTIQPLKTRLQAHLNAAKRGKNHRCNWIRSLLKKNDSPIIHLLSEVEGDGCKEEIEKIAYFKSTGTRLTNQTDGGEGTLGCHPSPETRKKQSEVHKGNKAYNYGKHPTEATRKKQSEATKGDKNPMYGKHRPEAVRKKLSDANKGSKHWNYGKHTPEAIKKKLSEAMKGNKNSNYGKHPTAATRKKQSDSHKSDKHWNYGKHTPKAVKKKISEALTGKHTPETTRKKQSEARKKYWKNKKEKRNEKMV